jgi:metal-responsive CopG/Arc/MetJ family transcriptional regulator
MKNTTTIAVSLPTDVAAQLDAVSKELNVSRSAVLTAVASLMLKWNMFEGMVNNGKTEKGRR